MRKILLASTALVGAFTLVNSADAQQLTTDSPFTVRIDGFANFRGGFVSESNQTNVSAAKSNDVRRAANSIAKAQGRSDDFKTDTEIHITATGKADNGLVYGMYVEIEADPVNTNVSAATTSNNIAGGQGIATSTTTTGSVNYIDEANIFLQGTWGRLEMGQQDGAGDQLFFGAPYDYGPAYGQGSGADGDALFRWANTTVQNVGPGSGLGSAVLYSWNVKALDSNDATKITYLSPVISGFRAGISFAPDGRQNDGFTTGVLASSRQNITTTSLAATNACTGAGAATCPTLPATGGPGLANNYGGYNDFQHWIELGAQWRGTVGDVGLGFNATYTHAEHKKAVFNAVAATPVSNFITGATGTVSSPTIGAYNFIDINSWAIGGQVSWMGLTFGGSYSNHGRSTYLQGPGMQRGQDAYAYVLGLQYAIGPWVVGYNYSYSLGAGSTSGSPGANGTDVSEWHSVGAKYILAPGLFLFAEYVHFNIYDESVSVNNGDIGMIGTGIRF